MHRKEPSNGLSRPDRWTLLDCSEMLDHRARRRVVVAGGSLQDSRPVRDPDPKHVERVLVNAVGRGGKSIRSIPMNEPPLLGGSYNEEPIPVNQVTSGMDLAVDYGTGKRCFRVTKVEPNIVKDEVGNEITQFVLHSGNFMIGVPDGETMSSVGPPHT
jgi:hypothetical protein